ncbi:MAG: glutamate racemase [Deltaproteobacteria bacterium]|nr:MAG: glutamate racemase [Deltaproteobacteria bacterium]
MNIVITDSGLGGLSVCAQLIHLLKNYSVPVNSDPPSYDIKITYVNAVPSNDRGYNTMSGEQEQIETFEKIISNTVRLISPDNIFVACGTLSVLLNQISPLGDKSVKIEGIFSIGIQLLMDNLIKIPKAKAIIMATPSTVSNNSFQTVLVNKGIAKNQIVAQSCPNLANEISNDPEGSKVEKSIQYWVKKSLQQLQGKTADHLMLFLGCTHYSYHENMFKTAFINEGFSKLTLLNPNYAAAEKLKNYVLNDQSINSDLKNSFSINFLTPYAIPELEKITLNKLLTPISSETSQALINAQIVPELLDD